MSSLKFKSDSYSVGGRHNFGTKNIVGEITFNKKLVKRLHYYLENVSFVINENQ